MKSVICSLAGVLMGIMVMAQSEPKIPLIGDATPEFKAQSTKGVIHFPDDFGTHWKLIVSFPKDFNPVCSSELLELACRQNDFKALNVDILVLATDSMSKHHLWLESLQQLCYKGRNAEEIDFPLLTDHNYSITREFGMLHYPYSSNRDIRGVFLIDPENTIRFVQFYPIEIGHNIEELERVIVALQTSDRDQVFTPANWQPGDDVIIPYPVSCTKTDPDVNQLTWYMTFRKTSDPRASGLAQTKEMDHHDEGVNLNIE